MKAPIAIVTPAAIVLGAVLGAFIVADAIRTVFRWEMIRGPVSEGYEYYLVLDRETGQVKACPTKYWQEKTASFPCDTLHFVGPWR